MGAGLRLPEEKRELFKQPLGSDIDTDGLKELDDKHMLITVGDVVSLTAREAGITPFLSIYDGYTERREMTGFSVLVENEDKTVVSNPPGMITSELTDAIGTKLVDGGLIRVDGEEDLALLPCILLAPTGTNIVYGWPGVGMKVVTTDTDIKEKIENLIKQMEEIE